MISTENQPSAISNQLSAKPKIVLFSTVRGSEWVSPVSTVRGSEWVSLVSTVRGSEWVSLGTPLMLRASPPRRAERTGNIPSCPRSFSDNFMVAKNGSSGKLIIVCGLPGSGKTTHARQLEAALRAVRFAPDEWMDALSLNLWDEPKRAQIEALQWQLAQQLLPVGVTVVIEWGTWGRSERDALRLRARELAAAVELHYLSAPLDVLFERVQRRRMENPPIKREQFLLWEQTFQPPGAEELALFDKGVTLQV